MTHLFIGNEPAPGHQTPPSWIWLKPVTDGLEIYEYEGGVWVLISTIALNNHTHTTLGAVNFTGDVHFGEKIYAGEGDSNKGKNETVVVAGVGTMTFKKGILTDFTPV